MSNVASISRIRRRYLLLRWIEVVLCSASGAAIGAGVAILLHLYWIPALITVGLAVGLWRFRSLSLYKVDDLKISLYLNRLYPQLKESSDLLLKDPGSLSALEQIQLNR